MNARQSWADDPLRVWLRQTRIFRRLSLPAAAGVTGMKAVTLGSYERGDRVPSPMALRQILNAYGYQLAVVPVEAPVPVGAVDTLRKLVQQFEAGQVAA